MIFRRSRGRSSQVVAAVLVGALLNASVAFAQGPAPSKGASAKPAAAAPPSPASAAPPLPPAAPAAPDLQGDAKRDYDAGKLLFGDGDFAGARLKFKAAYDATKDPRPLWNWAACEKNLRHYARALSLLNDYLKDDRLLPEERADATRLRDTLNEFTTPITITVTEAGADISIDGESVGQSPLAGPLTIDMGARKIDVAKAGFRPYSASVVIQPGTNAPIAVKLDPDVHLGHLVIKAPAGAAIAVDGAAMGVGSWQGTVASGGHSLRISASGMRVYQDEVMVMDDQTRSLDVTLEPEASGVPKWIWIAGGVVVAAGAAVGGYFLFKKPETTTQTTDGTLGSLPLQ
jgi:hypothetical protein